LFFAQKANKNGLRVIFPLALIFALRMFGLFTVLPVFAIYARELNNVTPFLVGVALGVYGLTQALFQLPFGLLSDKLGRKSVIAVGLLLFALGSVVSARSDSIFGVILGRCFQGMGAIGTVVMALAADLTEHEARLQAMALIGLTIGLSFVLALGIGPILNTWIGVRGIFSLTAGLAFLAIVILLVWVPKPPQQATENETQPLSHLLLKTAFDRQLVPWYLGVLILHASLTALFLKIPFAVLGLGFSMASTWQFYLPVFLGALLATALAIFWVKRNMIKLTLISSGFLCLAEVALLFFSHTYWGLAIGLFIFFTVFNILEASLPTLVTNYAKKGCRGTALGIYSSLQFLGLFLGGLVAGFLDSHYGGLVVFWFCVILAFGWFIWILQSKIARFEDGRFK
jgi:MFS family permease